MLIASVVKRVNTSWLDAGAPHQYNLADHAQRDFLRCARAQIETGRCHNTIDLAFSEIFLPEVIEHQAGSVLRTGDQRDIARAASIRDHPCAEWR